MGSDAELGRRLTASGYRYKGSRYKGTTMTTDIGPRRMTRTATRIWSSKWGRCAALALAVGVGAGGVATTRFAAAAGPAVTPKTEAPNEARGAVARVLVRRQGAGAVGRPHRSRGRRAAARRSGMHGRGFPAPGQGGDDDDNNIPPFFRRFFEFGPGEGFGGGPSPGPSHGVGSGSSSTPAATSSPTATSSRARRR